MLALKLLDTSAPALTRDVVDHVAGTADVAIEMANYGGLGFAQNTERITAIAPARKSFHLHHEAYALMDFIGPNSDAALRTLSAELAFIEGLRVGGGTVIHVARTATVEHEPRLDGSVFPIRWHPDASAVAEAIGRASSIGGGRCGPLFVENTFEAPEWFDELFAGLDAESDSGVKVGMCLDIGHANIWGGAPLTTWLDLADKLVRSGRPIHAHVHCNDGAADQHLPLVHGAGLGLLDARVPFCHRGMLQELIRLADICGPEHFVLENHIQFGLANLAWTRSALGGNPLVTYGRVRSNVASRARMS